MKRPKQNYRRALKLGILGDKSTPLILRVEKLWRYAMGGDLFARSSLEQSGPGLAMMILCGSRHALGADWEARLGKIVADRIKQRDDPFFKDIASAIGSNYPEQCRRIQRTGRMKDGFPEEWLPLLEFDLATAEAAYYVMRKIEAEAALQGKADIAIASITVTREEIRSHALTKRSRQEFWSESLFTRLNSVGVNIAPPRTDRVRTWIATLNKNRGYTLDEIERLAADDGVPAHRRTLARAAKREGVPLIAMRPGPRRKPPEK